MQTIATILNYDRSWIPAVVILAGSAACAFSLWRDARRAR